MTGTNKTGNMKVEMPSTNASGDPETITTPPVTENKSTKGTGTTSTTQKTEPVKPQTRK